MRLLWRWLVGLILVRHWGTHWLLIWGWRGESLAAYFGGPRRRRSAVRLHWYDSLLNLAGSDPGRLLQSLLRILRHLH